MTEIQFKGLKGASTALSHEILTTLQLQLRGSLCLADEAGYDEARTVWNAMIDRRPAAVVRCHGASDVMRAVRLARDNGLLVAVRGGGHNISGNAVCEGGLLIDLSPMRSVRVDPKTRTRAGRARRNARRVRQRGASVRVLPRRSASTRPQGSPGSHLAAASGGSAANSDSRWTI